MSLDRDLDLSCTLAPAALRARQAALLEELAAAVVELEETAGGYRFWFEASPDRLRQLADFIAFEKDCCSFLDFALEQHARSQRASLTISGPDGAKDTVRQLFVAPLDGSRAIEPTR